MAKFDEQTENQIIDALVARGFDEDEVLDAIVDMEESESFEGTCYASGKKAERKAKKEAKKAAKEAKKEAKKEEKAAKKTEKQEAKAAKKEEKKAAKTAKKEEKKAAKAAKKEEKKAVKVAKAEAKEAKKVAKVAKKTELANKAISLSNGVTAPVIDDEEEYDEMDDTVLDLESARWALGIFPNFLSGGCIWESPPEPSLPPGPAEDLRGINSSWVGRAELGDPAGRIGTGQLGHQHDASV